MGELIGPEYLERLRAERDKQDMADRLRGAKTRHPSTRGEGLEGLINDVQGLSDHEAEVIRGLFDELSAEDIQAGNERLAKAIEEGEYDED